MAYKMILNKEKFLKTEFGTGLQECIAAWDMYLTKLSGLNYQPSGEYAEMRKGATWCQAQWEVYKAAMKQFYSIEYNFTRTDNYYGVCTEDETDWLFKCYHSERQYYRVFFERAYLRKRSFYRRENCKAGRGKRCGFIRSIYRG